MAMGKGGVGIRLYIAGSEVVKRGFTEVADSGKKMWAQIALGEKSANPALVALSRASGEAQSGVEGLAAKIGGASRVLGAFGVAGVAASAALGGVIVAMNKAQESLAFADELDETAKKIGVTVTALQQYRDLAKETDVGTAAMDSSLQNLNATLGAFKSGVGDGKVKEAFAYLGFTPQQLASLSDASEFLPVLADRISQVGDKAERVKLAKMLGVEDILPALELGSARIRELMQAAVDGGRTVDEGLIQRLAQLDREGEKADDRLKAISTTFFSQFAPAVISAKNALADLLSLGTVDQHVDKDAAAAEAAATKWNLFGQALAFAARMQIAVATGNLGALATPKGADPLNPGFPLSAEASARIGSGQAQRAMPGSATPDALAAWRRDHPAGGGGGGGGRGARASGPDTYTGTLPPEVLAAIADGRMTEANARRLFASVADDLQIRIVVAPEVQKGETPEDIAKRTAITDALAAPDQNPSLRDGLGDLVRGPGGTLMSQEDKDSWARDVGDATAQGLDAALNGNFADYLRQQLYNAALSGLSDAVAAAFKNADFGGGGGGFWSTVISAGASLFGGGRAAGGAMNSGMWYRAGEHGQTELAMIGGGGHVTSHDETRRMLAEMMPRGGGGGGPRKVEIISKLEIPSGYVSDAALGGLFAQAHRAAVAEAVQTVNAAAPDNAIQYQFYRG